MRYGLWRNILWQGYLGFPQSASTKYTCDQCHSAINNKRNMRKHIIMKHWHIIADRVQRHGAACTKLTHAHMGPCPSIAPVSSGSLGIIWNHKRQHALLHLHPGLWYFVSLRYCLWLPLILHFYFTKVTNHVKASTWFVGITKTFRWLFENANPLLMTVNGACQVQWVHYV